MRPPAFALPRKDIVLNPILVVEVLSEDNAAFARGGKFHKYMKLESLREHVLVEQALPQVDVFYLQDNGQWVFDSYQDLSDTVLLRSLNVSVAMTDIYRDLQLAVPSH